MVRREMGIQGTDPETAHIAHVFCRRLAQLVDSGRGRVAMSALPDRAYRGLLHIGGRVKVRLPNAEADDVFSLARQLGHLGQHDEGVL